MDEQRRQDDLLEHVAENQHKHGEILARLDERTSNIERTNHADHERIKASMDKLWSAHDLLDARQSKTERILAAIVAVGSTVWAILTFVVGWMWRK